MTKIEILDFVVNHFNTHPRAIMPGRASCTYLNQITGDRCAHSICIEDSVLEEIVAKANADADPSGPYILSSDAEALIRIFGDDMHKPEFRGHAPEFWVDVQLLHDKATNWIEIAEGNELSMEGSLLLGALKVKYKND